MLRLSTTLLGSLYHSAGQRIGRAGRRRASSCLAVPPHPTYNSVNCVHSRSPPPSPICSPSLICDDYCVVSVAHQVARPSLRVAQTQPMNK